MGKQLKTISLFIGALIFLCFVLFMANQINGIYQLSMGISPVLGKVVLWSLIVLTVALFLLPVIIYLKLPTTLDTKLAMENPQGFENKFIKRLTRNKLLLQQGITVQSRDQLQEGLQILESKADEEIRSTASTVFLTTAISQYGKLDALTVLATQSRMVWKIAHIYYQRPGIREMIKLYANVGASTLMASELEDLDLSEQFRPMIRAMMKNSAGKSIPLVGSTANLIMDSLLEGTANAFLTLRVGIITKRYCGAMEVLDRGKVKRRAYAEASEMLAKIVLQSSGKIINSIVKATAKAGKDTILSGYESLMHAGTKVKKGITTGTKKILSGKKTLE